MWPKFGTYSRTSETICNKSVNNSTVLELEI